MAVIILFIDTYQGGRKLKKKQVGGYSMQLTHFGTGGMIDMRPRLFTKELNVTGCIRTI